MRLALALPSGQLQCSLMREGDRGQGETPNPALRVVREGFQVKVASNSVLKENELTWTLPRARLS